MAAAANGKRGGVGCGKFGKFAKLADAIDDEAFAQRS